MEIQVAIKPRLSQILRNSEHYTNEFLERGYYDAIYKRRSIYDGHEQIKEVRQEQGFNPVVADLLTAPQFNLKLNGSKVATYGMTLAHADISDYELCAWRGDCTKVCVLNNGNGRYDSVRKAWIWRTHLWGKYPSVAAYRLGWELGRAVVKHGEILFRPDVNSDLSWHKCLTSLGELPHVTVYGYTKNPARLAHNSDEIYGNFNYCYSWNENSNVDKVRRHLERGGKVAVVTSRKKGEPINPDALREFFGIKDFGMSFVDADKTDEWMLSEGAVIGDLSAKGKARQLIGDSTFVVDIY